MELFFFFFFSHSLSLANFCFSFSRFAILSQDILSCSVVSMSSLSPQRVFSSEIKKKPWRQKPKRYPAFYFLPPNDVSTIILKSIRQMDRMVQEDTYVYLLSTKLVTSAENSVTTSWPVCELGRAKSNTFEESYIHREQSKYYSS